MCFQNWLGASLWWDPTLFKHKYQETIHHPGQGCWTAMPPPHLSTGKAGDVVCVRNVACSAGPPLALCWVIWSQLIPCTQSWPWLWQKTRGMGSVQDTAFSGLTNWLFEKAASACSSFMLLSSIRYLCFLTVCCETWLIAIYILILLSRGSDQLYFSVLSKYALELNLASPKGTQELGEVFVCAGSFKATSQHFVHLADSEFWFLYKKVVTTTGTKCFCDWRQRITSG